MAVQTIPASEFANVIPGVVSAAGSGAVLSGLILTQNTRVPTGAPTSFPSYTAVAAYFGATSTEAQMAQVYFAGYTNSLSLPSSLLFAQYPATAVAGWMRGAALTLTLAQLQVLAASTLSIYVDGTQHTSSSINLSTAVSFSSAASIIQAAFGSYVVVSFDSQSNAFLFTSATTGSASSVSVATTSTFSTSLGLSGTAGAVVSPGAAAATPAAFMTAIAALTQNWRVFTTAFEAVTADKIAFAQWNSGQLYRYVAVIWDSDASPAASSNATASAGNVIVKQNAYDGTIMVGTISADPLMAAFVLGWAASLNFNQTNGRATLEYRASSLLTPENINDTQLNNYYANGYNTYVATALARFSKLPRTTS